MNDKLKNKIENAITSFIDNDIDLLTNDAHEQSISHRIAVYLEPLFSDPKYNIDCEYNKHLYDKKIINLIDFIKITDCKACKCDACKHIAKKNNLDNLNKKLFRPDILVHHRGFDDHNEIVIEVKKDNICPFDIAKIKALTLSKENEGSYNYTLGVFIFFRENKAYYKWFANGTEICK